MEGCGLTDVWVESDILGSNSCDQGMTGKGYKRTIRASSQVTILQAVWPHMRPQLMWFIDDCDSALNIKQI